MAPLRLATKAPTASACEVLETAYDGLRLANEELENAEREFCRLMATKMIYFPAPNQSERESQVTRDRRREYDRRGFGDQDVFSSEWWKRAHDAGLFRSVDNLGRELEKTNSLKTKLEGIQSSLRCCTNTLSRPFLRDLNLLDLPGEILLEIFELVEDFHFDDAMHPSFIHYGGDGRKDIQNVRLVCRRFCDVSSQLLVRLVRVNFTETSLACLEEISRHPTIAKGVRAVRVVLHLYNYSLDDFDQFVSYHADELEEQVNVFDGAKMWEFSNIPEQQALEMIADGRAVVSTLRRLLSAGRDDGILSEDDQKQRSRLHESHREYRIRLEKQEWLVRTGKFYWTVGSAIARMPGARKLYVTDFEPLQGACAMMIPGTDVWTALHRVVLKPMTGYSAKENDLELPDYQCVPAVIESARSAGALLTSIDIKLSTLGHPGSLTLAPDFRQQFSSGMQRLKEFAFRCEGYPTEQDGDVLNEFLSACLDTSSLQNLSLDMRRSDESARIDVGKVLGSKSRPKLTDIFFGRVAFDLSTLVHFLDRLPESMMCIQQEDVLLLSGTWKAALDALREKKCRVKLFREPKGAECDDMSPKDYEGIFSEERYGYRTEAQVYISNRFPGHRNPLQVLEERLDTSDSD